MLVHLWCGRIKTIKLLWENIFNAAIKATLLSTISLIKNTQPPLGSTNLKSAGFFAVNIIFVGKFYVCRRASLRLQSEMLQWGDKEVILGLFRSMRFHLICGAIEDEHLSMFILNLLTDLFTGTLGNTHCRFELYKHLCWCMLALSLIKWTGGVIAMHTLNSPVRNLFVLHSRENDFSAQRLLFIVWYIWRSCQLCFIQVST